MAAKWSPLAPGGLGGGAGPTTGALSGGAVLWVMACSRGRVGQGSGLAGGLQRLRGGARAAVLVRVRHDLLYVVLRLAVRRHAAVALHGAGAGVVGRERLAHVPAERVELLAQVPRAGVDRLCGIERVGAAERAGRARHQLREALGAGRAAGIGVEAGLLLDQAAEQRGIEAVLLSGAVDLGREGG